MGKRYYCEYCQTSMVDSPNIIKTHRNGLNHQKSTKEHYANHRDPESILKEESGKKPCFRFQTSRDCPFGAICKYSHYSAAQLEHFRQIVTDQISSESKKTLADDTSLLSWYDRRITQNEHDHKLRNHETTIVSKSGRLIVFPWKYPQHLEDVQSTLPPSLRNLSLSDFERDFNVAEWGVFD